MAVTAAANCAITHSSQGPRATAGDSAECRIARQTLGQLGDKWTLLVILALGAGPMRFNALQRAVVGISHRMLTVTVRKLERDGLILRTEYPEIPPHTEYTLTPLGVNFTEPVIAIANWAIDAHPEIRRNRERFDGRCRTPAVP